MSRGGQRSVELPVCRAYQIKINHLMHHTFLLPRKKHNLNGLNWRPAHAVRAFYRCDICSVRSRRDTCRSNTCVWCWNRAAECSGAASTTTGMRTKSVCRKIQEMLFVDSIVGSLLSFPFRQTYSVLLRAQSSCSCWRKLHALCTRLTMLSLCGMHRTPCVSHTIDHNPTIINKTVARSERHLWHTNEARPCC